MRMPQKKTFDDKRAQFCLMIFHLVQPKLYIKNLQEQKREFLNNYSPEEVKKLNSAEVRCFGNYIIFTVSDPDDKNYVFSKAEELLKK